MPTVTDNDLAQFSYGAADAPAYANRVPGVPEYRRTPMAIGGIQPGLRLLVTSRNATGHMEVKIGKRSFCLARRLAEAVRVRDGQ